MNDPKWVTFCKRTEDPKLAYIEYMLENEGITCRRNGSSFHAPILQVYDRDEEKAWDILATIDDIADDDPLFADGIRLRDEARADNYCDEMGELCKAGLSRGQP
jgi:hypothetical protein